MNSLALILPAAGSGERVQEAVAKPYLKLQEKPVLEHTIGRFLPLSGLEQIVIATSREYMDRAAEIAENTGTSIEVICVEGGITRQDSIYNALKEVSDVDLIAVHDAVRPFVRIDVIRKCCDKAAEKGAAVAGVPVRDTIKRVDDSGTVRDTPDRKYLWQAQTPQVFRREILLKAYKKAENEAFVGTDDATLVERLGIDVHMVEGNQSNFKITYPADLKLARILTEERED